MLLLAFIYKAPKSWNVQEWKTVLLKELLAWNSHFSVCKIIQLYHTVFTPSILIGLS